MKNSNPKDYLELLKVFSIGIIYDIINKNEITNWVDNIITKEDEPDHFFIELSLINNLSNSEISSLINDCIGESNSIVSSRVILSLLYTKLQIKQITLEKTINVIEYLCLNSNLSDNEYNNFRYRLSDDFYLAKDCLIGSLAEIEKKTIGLLDVYKELNLNNFDDWKEIDQKINIVINQTS